MNFSKRADQIRLLFPIGLIIIAWLLSISRIELSWFNTHMSRDLFRADQWRQLNFSDWLGPEMGWDYKRLPGPFYYWLLAAFSLFGSISTILLLKISCIFTAILFLSNELRKQFSFEVHVAFLLLFLLMPVFFLTSRNIWNPSLIVFFGTLQFLFFLKYRVTNSARWIGISVGTALMGMQVHFSTLLIFLAIAFAILLDSHSSRRNKLLLGSGLTVVFAYLALWYAGHHVPEFDAQLKNFYGWNPFLQNRIWDFSYHLSLSLAELKDYDLFTLLTRSSGELNLGLPPWLSELANFVNLAFLALFFTAFTRIFFNYRRSRNILDLFCLLVTIFFILSLIAVKNKEQVPYRYGLGFYPLQFFILSYGLAGMVREYKKWHRAFVILSASVFLFYFYFDFNLLKAMAVTGRSHHTNNDNLELNLQNKLQLYRVLKPVTPTHEDPFSSLHGRAANKFRLKELNWEQNLTFFSIYRDISHKTVVYEESMIDANPQKSWLLQLKNLQALNRDASKSYELTPLTTDQLPRQLSLTYLKEKEILKTRNWNNAGFILPAAFVPELNQVTHIQLNFNFNGKTGKFFNLLLDDNANYRFAYENIYELVQVKINSQQVQPVKKYPGFFLVQNQYIFALPEKDSNSVTVELKLNIGYRNFSRVDIFTTEEILPQEELFNDANLK